MIDKFCKAKCIESSPKCQIFDTNHPTPYLKRIILSGWNMTGNVKVGDEGTMQYQANSNSGLWFFIKDE